MGDAIENGTITYKVGDLLKSDEPVIAHGCNCQGVMGAGIARQVHDQYYTAFDHYSVACAKGEFHIGTAQRVALPDGRTIYNLGTQFRPGPDATPWGIFLAFSNMGEDMASNGFSTVGVPRIGAGIGGLDWQSDVSPAILEAVARCTRPFDVTVYDLPTATT